MNITYKKNKYEKDKFKIKNLPLLRFVICVVRSSEHMKHEATDHHCDTCSYEYILNKHLKGNINVTNPGNIL